MWDHRLSFVKFFGPSLVLLVVVGSADPARAQAPSREALLNAFDELRSKVADERIYDPRAYIRLKVPRGRETVPVDLYNGSVRERLARFKGVPLNDGTASNVKTSIKVWAVPIRNERLTNKKVHLAKYVWGPKEKFAIYFETATPVQVGFYQEFTGAEPKLVLPNTEFPDSYKTVKAGTPYRFPVDIELDDNTDEEIMHIVVVASGCFENLPPQQHEQQVNKPAQHHAVFGRKYTDALNKKFAEARRSTRFRATTSGDKTAADEDMDPGSLTETTKEPNDVAIIAYGDNEFGEITIRLKKKR
jgi:hypothetical protein